MKNKIAVITLTALMSAGSLYAFAANDTSGGGMSSDGTSQTRQPAPPSTNANPDAASLPKGADGGTTDNGPTPAGSKAGASGQAGGGSSSGGGNGGGG